MEISEKIRKKVKMDKWKVCRKGGPSTGEWELSVVRSSNKHGKNSYGWFDDDKLLISKRSIDWGSKHSQYKQIWKKLLRVAEEIAGELNDV